MSGRINLPVMRQRAETSTDRYGRGSYSHADVLALVNAVDAAEELVALYPAQAPRPHVLAELKGLLAHFDFEAA